MGKDCKHNFVAIFALKKDNYAQFHFISFDIV